MPLCLFGIAFLPGLLLGQPAPPPAVPATPNYSVRRAPGPIIVDGKLGDPGWEGAEAIPIAWEVAPGDNTPAVARTVCHVTFDAETLFLGCRASDPRPAEIRAHMVERDAVGKLVLDDLVGAYVDPFNDQRRAFIFLVNSLGVQADGVRSVAEGGEDFAWDAIWKSAGHLTPDGFEVELAIPFKSLRFPRTTDRQTWGVTFFRSQPRNVRYRMMSAPRDRRNDCDLCQANRISGFEGIAPGRNVELVPTLTGRRTDDRTPFPGGRLRTGNASAELGGDLHWGVTPNVSLNATVNPDFSQVEADAALLDVNTRFALFYPEKRPFFLEGAEFFATPIQAVFTRTIADPDGGIKVTGKVGGSTRNVVGVFAARDRLTNLLFPSNQGTGVASLEQDAWTAVSRFRRDLGRNSHLGVLYTGRFGAGYSNQVAAADGFYQLGRSTRLNLQYLASVTEYPDSVATTHAQPRGGFAGGALRVVLNHTTERWQAGFSYLDLSPEFRADAGFVPRVDVRTLFTYASRVFYRGNGWFNVLAVGPYASQTRNHGGVITDQDLGVEVNYQGPWQSFASMQFLRRDERYLGVRYRLARSTGYVNVKPAAGLSLSTEWQVGDGIDYGNAREAAEVTLRPSMQISIGRGLTVDLSDAFQRLSTGGQRIFTANIVQSTISYNFDVRTMVRAIVQFRNLDRNPASYPAPISTEEQNLLGQFLFAYRVNPQTVLFLGYAEDGFGTDRYDLTRASRTFFAKVGYAWRP
ncbi:MAG: DUF5916 domain-containing protein [Gemmatimonadales bacterium]|nr:DUF5916 domain-containing protein [Gemmatimonadales bacterium]